MIINMSRVLDVIPKGMIQHGRPRCTLEVNTEMDLEDVAYGTVDWIQLTEATSSCGLYKRVSKPSGLTKGVIILD